MQGYWTLVQHAETEYLRDKDPMSSVIISQRFTFTKSVPQGVSGQITASWTPNEIDLTTVTSGNNMKCVKSYG